LKAIPQAGEGGVLQPRGLARCLGLCLWKGEGSAGCGRPAAAGGGHWRLVSSQLLPVAEMVGRTNNAGSALFWSGHQGQQVEQTAGLGY
jgi:hypothetical protein